MTPISATAVASAGTFTVTGLMQIGNETTYTRSGLALYNVYMTWYLPKRSDYINFQFTFRGDSVTPVSRLVLAKNNGVFSSRGGVLTTTWQAEGESIYCSSGKQWKVSSGGYSATNRLFVPAQLLGSPSATPCYQTTIDGDIVSSNDYCYGTNTINVNPTLPC